MVVKPGEKISTDGIVEDGESYVDESAITGEPVPVYKDSGKNVVGGTINQNGMLKFRATKIGKDTVLAQIIKMVEVAQGSKPPVQRIADRAVTYFIPTILLNCSGILCCLVYTGKHTTFRAYSVDFHISGGMSLCIRSCNPYSSYGRYW